MSAIDEVKQRTDIVAVVSQYTALKKAGRNLTGLCPFHSEKHGSFFVFPEQQSWHCFGACATGGDVLSFMMKKEGLTFGEALRLLAEKAGVNLPEKPGQAEKKEELAEYYQINQVAAEFYHNLLLTSPAAEKARRYIAGRGILPQTITDFQLGYSPDSWESLKQHLTGIGYPESSLLKCGIIIEADNGKTHDRFRGRFMFPIRDARGRTIGFGARALDDAMPKYMNSAQSPVFDKSSVLYGIDRAAHAIRQQDRAVIVEGYMDVIMAHQYNINNVIASMGTSITETQVLTLRKLTKNLVLVLDADAAGEQAMLRGSVTAIKPAESDVGQRYVHSSKSTNLTLNESDTHKVTGRRFISPDVKDIDVRIVVLPEGKDPDNVILEDIALWNQLVEQAIPQEELAFKILTTDLDLTTAKGKSVAVERLIPLIAEITNEVRQAHYIQQLAGLVKMNVKDIESILGQLNKPVTTIASKENRGVEQALRNIVSDPLEGYCLALLLQHPELKEQCAGFSAECFTGSDNREIFTAWQECPDTATLKDKLDPNIHERLDAMIKKEIPATQLEKRLSENLLRLQEKFFKNMEARKGEMLAEEAESGGAGADLARLEEQGMQTSVRLGEVQKQRRSDTRR